MIYILRTTILLFIISITFVSGCSEMVGTKSEKTDQNSFAKIIQSEYESSGISEILRQNYTINWNVFNSSFSKDLGGAYHEFSINKNRVNNASKGSPLTLKLIAVENGNSYSFFILKFLEKGNVKTPGLSWKNFADFSGQVFLIDESDK